MKQYISDLLAIVTSYSRLESTPQATEIPVPEAYNSWAAADIFQRNLQYLLGRQI